MGRTLEKQNFLLKENHSLWQSKEPIGRFEKASSISTLQSKLFLLALSTSKTTSSKVEFKLTVEFSTEIING